jgi:uncharacterized protein (DUF1684 family)
MRQIRETRSARPERSWRQWRQERLQAVNAPDGPAALRRTWWLDDGGAVPGLPGQWSVSEGLVEVTLPPGQAALIDGQRHADRFTLRPFELSAVWFPEVTVRVTSQSGRLGLRLFDHARVGSVEALDAFPLLDDWVIEGEFEALPEGASQLYDFAVAATTRDLGAVGVVSFVLDGRRYETRPFSDGDSLTLVFSDETTGVTTKPPCRFLDLALPAEPNWQVIVDFNRSYLPPCAFSDEYNCPLPPVGHRFAVPVEAGEREVTWKTSVSSAG